MPRVARHLRLALSTGSSRYGVGFLVNVDWRSLKFNSLCRYMGHLGNLVVPASLLRRIVPDDVDIAESANIDNAKRKSRGITCPIAKLVSDNRDKFQNRLQFISSLLMLSVRLFAYQFFIDT